MSTALERLRKSVGPLARDGSPAYQKTASTKAADLQLLIVVAEKALKMKPLFNLMADEEIELDDALQALTQESPS
jgi:hypothetical protein